VPAQREQKSLGILMLLLLVPVAGQGLVAQQRSRPVQAIPTLDLVRYAGLWYEVARLPNQFQNRCAALVTAEYQLLTGKEIRVINRCQTLEGKSIRAEGRARLAKPGGPASRLKVRFAPAILSWLSMVWGDYWVLDLAEDYSAALVGTPDRRYLWILSRTPELDPAVYDRMVATAGASGFDLDRLQRTSPY
jgi:apolipoprotein D and lipocalin family protein